MKVCGPQIHRRTCFCSHSTSRNCFFFVFVVVTARHKVQTTPRNGKTTNHQHKTIKIFREPARKKLGLLHTEMKKQYIYTQCPQIVDQHNTEFKHFSSSYTSYASQADRFFIFLFFLFFFLRSQFSGCYRREPRTMNNASWCNIFAVMLRAFFDSILSSHRMEWKQKYMYH